MRQNGVCIGILTCLCATQTMPKRLPPDLLQRVKTLLEEHPNGLTLADIENSLRNVVSRRSLQRRLDEWTRAQVIRAEGIRRGRRYFYRSAVPEARVVTPPTAALNVQGRPPDVRQGIPISN